MYEYIDYVLSSYFSAQSESSEDEAVAILRKHIGNSAELASGLKDDLQRAFADSGFSWATALAEHDVVALENEREAFLYAKRILWEPFFFQD